MIRSSDKIPMRCPRCERRQRVPATDRRMVCRFCELPLEHTSARPKALGAGKRKPRPSLADFHASVCADGACALAYLGGCDGKLDAHHHYPAQRIRRMLPKEQADLAVQDPRVGVPCCRRHHELIEARRVPSPRPPFFDEWLADYGLADPDERAEAA